MNLDKRAREIACGLTGCGADSTADHTSSCNNAKAAILCALEDATAAETARCVDELYDYATKKAKVC